MIKILLLVFSALLLFAQPLTNENFPRYKKLAPEVLDIMNNKTNHIVTCFKKEKSYNNINECISISGQPIEALITSLIPEQTDKLCIKDLNGKLGFVWSEKNYQILISTLEKTIHRNNANKKCLKHSKTVEEYAKCLVKSKAS